MPSLHDTGILAPGRTPRQIRIAGLIFLLCGLVLAGITGAIAFAVFVVPLRPDLLPDGVRYAPEGPVPTGLAALVSPAGGAVVFLLALSLSALLLGGGMAIRGRASRPLVYLLVGLCMIFIAAGLVAALLNGDRVPRLYF